MIKKILFVLLTFALSPLLYIQAQSIQTHFKKIGEKGAYEKEWNKFTLSDNGYLIIENGITLRFKVVDMKDPIKEDDATIYEYTCKEKNGITHKFTMVIPDELKDNVIMVIDRMTIGKREMPIAIYSSKKF